ncbi:hypothetical protein B0H15DRAFT_1018610 [Mycena belliarum]|uniref:Uncharacterized protein n=1 Tax=Mycena belliarum TaxID=1033014 RepID=A0AAD6UE81_9AGAR|nr:hypothetical protein B0H15DRAFT_1018610 [Mycena belliae]
MSPQHPSQDPSGSQDVHSDHADHATTSFRHIHQPQPIRPIPGVWDGLAREVDRTYVDEHSYDATNFPGPQNTLGLFSSDPKHSAAVASPSRPSRHTPLARRKIQDYEIQGGWSFDASGRTHYVPHGGIKEVSEDGDDLPPTVPRDVDLLVEESPTFFENEPLPPETTPPPRPVQRTVELLPLSFLSRLALGEGSNTYTGALPPTSPHDLHDFTSDLFDSNDPSTTMTPSTCSSSTPAILTQSQELNIVEQNLMSLTTGSLDVVSLHATFAALPGPLDADLALCNQIGEALHAVQESLRRRAQISPEEWRLRSTSCQRKYDYRLISLRKTLQRLHLLSASAPRVHQFSRLRELLKHHYAKLSDLAAKFNATFDRLRSRHFSNLLGDVYTDIQRRTEGRKEERKILRAARRPYDSVFHREGRRPSLVEVL